MSSSLPIVFLFSGQGSQYRGMGRVLFESEPVFRESMIDAEAIVQRQLNRSLLHELYEEETPTFDDLLITHPAIVAVEVALLRTLEEKNILPRYISGNSLGEFAAAVAAGAWSGAAAIETAIEQAKAIIRHNATGGMLAVLHDRSTELTRLYEEHGLFLASDNFDGHFTLAGKAPDLDLFQSRLEQKLIQFLRLPVGYPFHSPLIDGAQGGFVYHNSLMPSFEKPRPGFVSGLNSTELDELPHDYFWQVARGYTDFRRTVNYLEAQGPGLYIDLGPSGTAANFVRYHLGPAARARVFSIMSPYNREREQLEALGQLLCP